jgi:hypothetical protein
MDGNQHESPESSYPIRQAHPFKPAEGFRLAQHILFSALPYVLHGVAERLMIGFYLTKTVVEVTVADKTRRQLF